MAADAVTPQAVIVLRLLIVLAVIATVMVFFIWVAIT
jgi:hypothetical protein